MSIDLVSFDFDAPPHHVEVSSSTAVVESMCLDIVSSIFGSGV